MCLFFLYVCRLISCIAVNTLLKRIYGTEQVATRYSNTLSSVAFAGTIVGMLVFGYVSDRVSRKFGMVSALCVRTHLRGLLPP